MNFSGEKVISKKYGTGYVTGEPDGNSINVRFEDGREVLFSTEQSFALGVVCFENEKLNEYVKGLYGNYIEGNTKKTKDTLAKLNIPGGLQPSTRKTSYQNKNGGNIAVKCTYCDGGNSNLNVGFKGICSDEIMKYNTKNRTWCKDADCPCKQFVEKKISREELKAMDVICNEYQMLNT